MRQSISFSPHYQRKHTCAHTPIPGVEINALIVRVVSPALI